MRFSIPRSPFLEALKRIGPVTDRSSTMPILGNVLLASADKRLRIAATDLVTSVRQDVDCVLTEPGGITLPAKDLTRLVASFVGDEVLLEEGDHSWVTLRCGRSRYRLAGMAAASFPALPAQPDTPSVDVKGAPLLAILDKAAIAVCRDANRFHLNGVRIEWGESTRAVATDSHRLCLAEDDLDTASLGDPITLPERGARELLRLLADSSDVTLSMDRDRNHLHVTAGTCEMAIKLILLPFIDYHHLFAESYTWELACDRVSLLGLYKRVALVAPINGGVELEVGEAETVLRAANPERGEAEEVIAAECKGAPGDRVRTNGAYVADVLERMSGTEVLLGRDERENAPLTLREPGYQAVIMPMR